MLCLLPRSPPFTSSFKGFSAPRSCLHLCVCAPFQRSGAHWKLRALMALYEDEVPVQEVCLQTFFFLVNGQDRLAPLRVKAILACGAPVAVSEANRRLAGHPQVFRVSLAHVA